MEFRKELKEVWREQESRYSNLREMIAQNERKDSEDRLNYSIQVAELLQKNNELMRSVLELKNEIGIGAAKKGGISGAIGGGTIAGLIQLAKELF